MLSPADQLRELEWLMRHEGRAEGARNFLLGLCRPLAVRKELLWLERDLADREPWVEPPAGIVLRRTEQADLERCRDLLSPFTIDRCRERLQGGDSGILALHGDEIAHCFWITYRPTFDFVLGEAIPVGPSDVYLLNVVTPAKYRGRGIAQAAFCYGLDIARSDGKTRATVLVAAHNTPIVRVTLACGFRPTRRWIHNRVLGYVWGTRLK